MLKNAFLLFFALLTLNTVRPLVRNYHEYNNLHFHKRQCPTIKTVLRKIPIGCKEECDFTVNCTAFNYKSDSQSQPEFCDLLACGTHPNYPIGQGSELIGYSLKKIPIGFTNYNGPETKYYSIHDDGCYFIAPIHRHKTYVECEELCEDTPLCIGYNFNLKSFDCGLFHCEDPLTPPGGYEDKDWQSWSKKTFIEGEYKGPNEKYYSSAQQGCYHIHPTRKGTSLKGCMVACNGEPYCIGFNLNLHKKFCELFYCKDPTTPANGDTELGWQSYVKKHFIKKLSRTKLYIEIEAAKINPDSDGKCTLVAHYQDQNYGGCKLFCDIHKACIAFWFSSANCVLLTCRHNPPVPILGFSDVGGQTYVLQEVKEEGWTPLTNACIKYYKYKTMTEISIGICQQICERDTNCRSISYDVSNNDCYFSELGQSAAQYTEPCYLDGHLYTEIKLDELACKRGADYVGGQCLRFSAAEARSWHDAALACDFLNSQLATLKYPLTVLAYTQARFDDTEFWAGGSDIKNEGIWTWMASKEFFAFPWSGFDEDKCRYQPDNFGGSQNCLVVNWRNGCFDDQVCDQNPKRYICEDHVETREVRNYYEYPELYFSKKQCPVISQLYVNDQNSNPVRWCVRMCDNTPGCTEVNYYNSTGFNVYEDCILLACGNDPPYPEGQDPRALSYSLKIITDNYTHYEGPHRELYSTAQGCIHIQPTLRNKSNAECDESCDSDSNCIGYNFNRNNYDCELFFCDNPETSPKGDQETNWEGWSKRNFRKRQTQSYIIFPGAAGYIYHDRQCKAVGNYDDRRDILYDHRNWDYCKRRCDIHKQCTAFNYHQENGCVLRDCGQYPPSPGKYPDYKIDGWQAYTLEKLIGCRDFQKNCQNNEHFCNTKIGRNECAFTCGLCGEDFKSWSPGYIWPSGICPLIGNSYSGSLFHCKEECSLRGCTAFNYVPQGSGQCELLNCPLPVLEPTTRYRRGWFGYSRTTARFSKYYGPYGHHFGLRNGDHVNPCATLGHLNKSEATYVECEKQCDQEPWCTGFNFDNNDETCDLVGCYPRDLIPEKVYPEQIESWSRDIITDPEPAVRCPSYKCTLDNAVGLRNTCDDCLCNSNPICYLKCKKCKRLHQ